MSTDPVRPAWIEVDLAAIRHNVASLRDAAAPAELCAVVKADGYGHGAVAVARQALRAGAAGLAVALVEEGVALRAAGITAPILVLSEPPPDALDDLIAHDLAPTLYRRELIDRAEEAARRAGVTVGVHVSVDTGMRRVGAEPAEVPALVDAVVAAPHLDLAGLSTHFAVADEPDNPFTEEQIRRFDRVRAELAARKLPTGTVHAANSAATLRDLGTYGMARCGISLYGLAPARAVGEVAGLRPALSLHARVAFAKWVDAGEAMSYGLRYRLERRSRIATVPLGYADGVRRDLAERGGQVLIGGCRYPIAGTITMDQLLVDCGSDGQVAVVVAVVLLGVQGSE